MTGTVRRDAGSSGNPGTGRGESFRRERAHTKYSVFGFVRRSVDDFAAFICADRRQAVAPCL